MLFWQEIKAHKYRFLKTCVLYASFIFLGLNAALPGATLLDLQIAVDVGVEQITLLLPSRSAGYALGAFANSLAVNKIDTQICLLFSLTSSIIVVAAIPWNRSFIGLCVNLFVSGFLTGILDAAGNVWLIHLWGKVNPPFMQALHFMFGFGAFVAPFIAEPFLLPLQRDQHEINHDLNATQFSNLTNPVLVPYTANDLKIPYPFSIVSLYTFVVVIALFFVYMKKRDNKPHPSRQPDPDAKEEVAISKCTFVSIVAITSTFLLIYCGLELTFGTLLLTFAVKSDLRLDKSTAAFLTSTYWGGYTFFRLLVVLFVEKIGCQNLLFFDLFIIMLSNAFLMPFGNKYLWGLWTGVTLIGIGTSSVFAAVFGFLEDFIPVSGRMTSTFMISVTVGEFILPFIIGKYADTNPSVFLYITLICSIMLCVSFFLLILLKNRVLRLKNKVIHENPIYAVKF